jgi:hypothetical protein
MDETGRVEVDRVDTFVTMVELLPDDMLFSQWLTMMRMLQEVAYGAHYDEFTDDYRGDSMLMNLYALVCEVVEMGDEMGWKPWSSPRGFVNREPAIEEAVDQMHFQGNLLSHCKATGTELGAALKKKALKNLERQLAGYDTRNKCPNCHRDHSGAPPGQWVCHCGVYAFAKDQDGTIRYITRKEAEE